MAIVHYQLITELKVQPENFINITNKLELSLPCYTCKRIQRTIVFKNIDEKGICTPPQKCNGFQGKIIDREIIKSFENVKVKFLINFNYEPFVDKKYNLKSDLNSKWGRISFYIRCDNCNNQKEVSTQENLVRPYMIKCDCGNTVYIEDKSPFTYEVVTKN